MDTNEMTVAAIVIAVLAALGLAIMWRDRRRRREAAQWQMRHMGMSDDPSVRASRDVH